MRRILGLAVLAMLLLAVVLFFFARPEKPEVKEKPIPVAPTVEYDEAFVVPAVAASPVAAVPEITDCEGETCAGADPQLTGCAKPERGGYIQTTQVVHDMQGNTLGTLTVRGNYLGCGGVLWAQFTDIAEPLTFELRVVEDTTGRATEPIRVEDAREDAWTPMLHSPDGRVRAELVVFDEDGKVVVTALTDS